MSEHISKKFDAELESIRTRVLQMGGLVEQQIIKALEGLQSGDMHVIDHVIESDRQVNQLEVQLDEDCNQVIARRQPTARDLRMVSTVIKVINDLERIGDEAKKIAKFARRIYGDDVVTLPPVRLSSASDLALDMLRKALDAFARLDVAESARVVRQDKEVDAEFKSITRQLITYMMEDPRTISSSLDVLFVAKSIERIGDHAKNISEYVVFLVKGRDVRHATLEEIEREATE